MRARLGDGTAVDDALLAELDAGAQPVMVHTGRASVVLAQTKLRLEHLDGVAVRVGAGLEDLEAFARSHPDAPTSTFFTAGSVVDGFVVVAGPRTLLVCTFPTDRPMSPAAT